MFPVKDLLSNLQIDQIIDPVETSIDINSSSVDMLDYSGVLLLAHVGESGDTLSGSVYLEIEVQVSDDDSAWAAAPDADVRDTVVGTNTGTLAKIDAAAEDDVVVSGQYTGLSRFVRLVANVTGTHTNGILIGATAIRGGKVDLPV